MACELATYDICISEGTDYTLVMSLLDDNDLPVDLSGATAELRLKIFNSTTPYVGAVNGNSVTFTVPDTVVFGATRGTYQADYTIGTITKRMLRGDVIVERVI